MAEYDLGSNEGLVNKWLQKKLFIVFQLSEKRSKLVL